ncbi:hypothetical protein F383_23836 [Gossypium arboreum]|uniref:Uncharacterized protein n=1 Tax=Gossypium arboreum TaxID=29729 RepID=A0A0B0NNU1_GOSAR|nr:hypothetical protein F383_23836 [Gossypium arboreum]
MPKSPQNWPFLNRGHAHMTRPCAITPAHGQGC